MKAEKRLFLMSPAELALLNECSNPPALLVVRNGETPSWNKFSKAMEFWEGMASIHGFDLATLEPPRDGEHMAYYRAAPVAA